jgi:hypothetical protein
MRVNDPLILTGAGGFINRSLGGAYQGNVDPNIISDFSSPVGSENHKFHQKTPD